MTQLNRKPGRDRFEREFAKIARRAPWINRLRKPGWTILRVLLGLVLIAGGFLAILPVFGLWMIPVGLLLLAIDIPPMQGPIAAFIVRARRRWQRLRKPW